ncbi:unnamed protein product [Darwinula stevensoni]|uniref:Uncharacterized protein n=1 Tax=Darwinula stevensoni TaxID=69355 RepID=A0A7R9FTP7_9CRUS|nr:unnamed protein product [Darwinula stevensoni]CAG0906004.1 unnamed protein product [Darwinula stevensoni]
MMTETMLTPKIRSHVYMELGLPPEQDSVENKALIETIVNDIEKAFESGGVPARDRSQVLRLVSAGSKTAVSMKLAYDLPALADDPIPKMTTLAGANIIYMVVVTGKDKRRAKEELQAVLDADLKAEVEKTAISDPDLKPIAKKLGQIPDMKAATTHLMQTALRWWRLAMGKDPSMEDSVIDTSSLIASVQNSLPAAEDKDQVGTLLSALSALFTDDILSFSEVILSINPPLYTDVTVVNLKKEFEVGVHDTATHPDAIALAQRIQEELRNDYLLAGGVDVGVNVSLPFAPSQGGIEANALTTFSTDTVEATRVTRDAARIAESNGIDGTSVTVTSEPSTSPSADSYAQKSGPFRS